MSESICMPPPATGDESDLMLAISEVERQFGLMVLNARKNIQNRASAIHPDLQPLGYKVLTILSRSGPQQQVHLAEEVRSDKAMMSRTIKHLEALGLITRTPDPQDGRAMLIQMTPEARARYNETVAEARELLTERFSAWDVEDVRSLADLLARLNGARS